MNLQESEEKQVLSLRSRRMFFHGDELSKLKKHMLAKRSCKIAKPL